MEKQHNTAVSFAIGRISTEQFAIIESNYQEAGPFNLSVNFRFAVDKEKRMIGVFAGFTFDCEGKQFLMIEVGCHFIIKPDSWLELLDTKKESLTVPKAIIQHLAVITVGTARGVLHAKTENTKYNIFHLPTINVIEMIPQDQVFDFEKK